jgi:ADP-ribosylglycohydrolase
MTDRENSGPPLLFVEAVRTLHQELSQLDELHSADLSTKHFPNSPLTIVPLALALGTITNSVEEAVLLATNIGGDSDSVASIAGGIVGARYPDTIPAEWQGVVETVNGHDLVSLAVALGVLRH